MAFKDKVANARVDALKDNKAVVEAWTNKTGKSLGLNTNKNQEPINKNHYLSLVFNQRRCHGNSTHPSQNARINTSVINLDSCKKWAPKHK